jgi:hypothetical protein
MPLIYLPLIMYTSWMEFFVHPLCHGADRSVRAVEAESLVDRRAHV